MAVDLSHKKYPRVKLDPRPINKSAGFESPGFRAESALPTRISGRNPAGIRDESARIQIVNGIRTIRETT